MTMSTFESNLLNIKILEERELENFHKMFGQGRFDITNIKINDFKQTLRIQRYINPSTNIQALPFKLWIDIYRIRFQWLHFLSGFPTNFLFFLFLGFLFFLVCVCVCVCVCVL